MAGELILIVEDNEKSRKLVRDVLQVKGYHVIESETGEQAVVLAREKQPVLVIMDIHLPDIDGIAAFKRLRMDPRTARIPVMAVTASAMHEERARVDAAGFDAYQSKPIHVTAFLATVTAILDNVGKKAGP